MSALGGDMLSCSMCFVVTGVQMLLSKQVRISVTFSNVVVHIFFIAIIISFDIILQYFVVLPVMT